MSNPASGGSPSPTDPIEVARQALLAARRSVGAARRSELPAGQRAAAGLTGSAGSTGSTGQAAAASRARQELPQRSGPGPDARDPHPLGEVVGELSGAPPWRRGLAVGVLLSRWAQLVGSPLAEHAHPESLSDHVLVVRTDSTAWATQLRLYVPVLLHRLAEDCPDVDVERVVVQGPDAPSWRRGPRHIPGRGPRDTYG